MGILDAIGPSAGYFPSALRAAFPNGVAISLSNRSTQPYTPDLGHRLLPASTAGQPESSHSFLSRLPKSVIKDGKIITIRSEIAAMLQAKPVTQTSVALVPADTCVPSAGAHQDIAEAENLFVRKQSPPGCDAVPNASAASARQGVKDAEVTLRIKREDGKEVYVLTAAASTSMAQVYAALRRRRQQDASLPQAFELRSAFPPQVFGENDVTLAAHGLVPNVLLFIKAATAEWQDCRAGCVAEPLALGALG